MKTKILGMLGIVLGVFLFAGVVSASDADILQPAGDIVYNEQLIVNGTAKFDSIYVGKQGVGGVTFFNGTIVNSTTGEGDSDNPVTFGDNVRIDGEIYRTEKGGDSPLKVSDHVIPTLTETNNLGAENNRWNNLYVVNGNFSGDIRQSIDKGGAVKALVHVNSDGTCNKDWTFDGSTVTCTKASTGYYSVDFNFSVIDRYTIVSPMFNRTIHQVFPSSLDSKEVLALFWDQDGVSKDSSFILTVY